MARGQKPDPPGTSNRQRAQWNIADEEGWQHGRKPTCPRGLTDDGKKAWATWLGAWWACFYTPDDIPGLELTVLLYDKAMRGDIDIAKVTPMLDRYGITPKGRQDLRWARKPVPKPAAAPGTAPADELGTRRQQRESRVS